MTGAIKNYILIVLAWGLMIPGSVSAQEEIQTPSQKTKEAVQKLGQAPTQVGKGLEAIKEVGRAVMQETLGGKTTARARQQPVDLTVPQKSSRPSSPAPFSAAGLRDPFRPFSLRTRTSSRPRDSLSPLERYELGQLKVVGIVWDIKEPRAMVEDTAGLGYIVKIGTAIGSNEGKVKSIKPNEVIVEEIFADLYGARKTRQVSMRLTVE